MEVIGADTCPDYYQPLIRGTVEGLVFGEMLEQQVKDIKLRRL